MTDRSANKYNIFRDLLKKTGAKYSRDQLNGLYTKSLPQWDKWYKDAVEKGAATKLDISKAIFGAHGEEFGNLWNTYSQSTQGIEENKNVESSVDTAVQEAQNAYTENPNKVEGVTRVVETAQQGDVIVSSNQTRDTSNNTLRPSFEMAGTDQIEAHPDTDVARHSDDLFNQFDFVADGFGLGSKNSLFLQNKLNEDRIRYAEPMDQPRKMESADMPFRLMKEHHSSMNASFINGEFKENWDEFRLEEEAIARQDKAPVVGLIGQYHTEPSARGLSRGQAPYDSWEVSQTPVTEGGHMKPVFTSAGYTKPRNKLTSTFDTLNFPLMY